MQGADIHTHTYMNTNKVGIHVQTKDSVVSCPSTLTIPSASDELYHMASDGTQRFGEPGEAG
jgi:hypothetical protein